jgi:magnesium chelatase family protein
MAVPIGTAILFILYYLMTSIPYSYRMAFAKTYTVTQTHLKSEIITVETDVSKGLHHFSIVGLGDKTVEEAKERCALAIKHSKLRSPRQSNEKILISLAPAHIRKTGTAFDLAISIGYLLASGQIVCDVSRTVMLGELSLNGEVKRVKGIIPMIQKAITEGFTQVLIPIGNSTEASVMARDIRIIPCSTLKGAIDHLLSANRIPRIEFKQEDVTDVERSTLTFDQIKGNELAKRALLIALSGGHNVCLYGPPGTGKTMLARASADVLPKLTFDEQVQLTSIYSLSSEYGFALKTRPPFRSPHHSASYSSIVGGGRDVVPGEITLSHLGILFLDEFPEFDRRVIDSLRQPLEDKVVRIARTGQKVEFPCDFQLICSMNPCPCGYLNTGIKECVCATMQIQKYNKKISGPIIDRIEVWIEVSKIAYEKLIDQGGTVRTEHDQISRSVVQMRTLQKRRFGTLVSRMSSKDLSATVPLSPTVKQFYDAVASQLQISARAYTNVLKVAFTISLLENCSEIQKEHLLEALSYRPQEKFMSL